MEGVSIEQIIVVKAPDYARWLKISAAVLAIASAVLILMTPVGILFPVIFCIILFFLFKYYDAEYEYTLVADELTVDRITTKSHRKRCGVYNLGRVEIMAPLDSEKLRGYAGRKYKVYNYTSNTERSKVYVLIAPCNNELVQILWEPNEKMKESVWKLSPSKITL